MRLTLSDIEKVNDRVSLPRLLSLSWDIESSDTRGPGFFPVGYEPTSYLYTIQMDFYWIFEQTPFQRYCITTLPINQQLFFSKYSDCLSSNFHFIICDSEISLLLNFARIFHNFKPDFEFGYNTGGYDWNFILSKVEQYNITRQFNNILLGTTDDVLINIRETEVRYKERDVDEVMRKYEFAGININNRSIKVNPTEKIICEYYYISGTVFLDLLVWAKKTFPTEIKNTLNDVLVRCSLQGKIDLLYLPTKSDLKSMFIYVNAIKFKDNLSKIQDFSSQLVSLQNVDYESCMNYFLVTENQLEHYAADIIYYCATD